MGQIIEPCLVELGAHRPPFRQPQVARLALDRPVTLRTRWIAWQWYSVGVVARELQVSPTEARALLLAMEGGGT
jgi:hypothetical protein